MYNKLAPELKKEILTFLIDNKQELVNDIKPNVKEYLAISNRIPNHFWIQKQLDYEKFIDKQLKLIVISQYNLSPEELLLLFDDSDYKHTSSIYYERGQYVNEN
jgi:hypothetical protein